MDPRFSGEWSAFEIQMVKSHIERNKTNNKQSDIVDELKAMFPLKKKHEVTNLYVELMKEMMQTLRSNQPAAASNNLINDNFGIPMEDPAMGNTEVLYGSIMEEVGAMRRGEEAPLRQPTTQKERQHTRRFWTKEEHRKFLCGLHVYGRGNWKNISRHFVPNKTPVQISSHAQKYFRRLENPTKKQRYSINDVGLYDFELWAQSNASCREGLTFAEGAHNPNHYGCNGQPAAMNNMAHARLPVTHNIVRASNIQYATLASGQQPEMGASSSFVAPVMDGSRSHMAPSRDQRGDFLVNQWAMNMRKTRF